MHSLFSESFFAPEPTMVNEVVAITFPPLKISTKYSPWGSVEPAGREIAE